MGSFEAHIDTPTHRVLGSEARRSRVDVHAAAHAPAVDHLELGLLVAAFVAAVAVRPEGLLVKVVLGDAVLERKAEAWCARALGPIGVAASGTRNAIEDEGVWRGNKSGQVTHSTERTSSR
jgi:hypothetical protein